MAIGTFSLDDTVNEREFQAQKNRLDNGLNPKSFEIGSVVYFVEKKGNEYRVKFGTVIDHYSGEIAIQLYHPRDRRTIDGVPLKDVHTPTEWKKLPKRWTYDTELFVLDSESASLEEMSLYLDNPDDILLAIEKGYLVRENDYDHCTIHAQIDNHLGWRIVRDYSSDFNPSYISVHFLECYATYAEAKAVIDGIEDDLYKIADMSDRDWSIAQIDRTLDRWVSFYSKTEEEKQKVRERLLALDNLDDVVTRLANGGIEWKYDKNKRWLKLDA